jgi:perosamine synthetase
LKPLKIAEPWFDETEGKAVAEVMASGQLIQAGRVLEFERLFAAEVGAEHAVMVTSGTAALHLVMLACDIGPGDAVAVPDYTFVATANAVARTGATPLFVDVLPDTYNMDAQALQKLVARWAAQKGAPRLRMVMPVHQFGLPAERETLTDVAKEHGLLLIEDAACALGSRYRGRGIGDWGAASCFSFHPRKVITTGEGGAVVTNDARLADRLRALRAHGFVATKQGPELAEPGLNYRMTELQAAIGIGQMAKLPAILERRRTLAAKLTAALAGISWFTPPVAPAHILTNWQSYVGILDPAVDRGRIIERLGARGIEARPGATALHRLRAYRERPAPGQPDCPVSAMLDERTLALPLHPGMGEADVARVAAEMRSVDPR